MDSMARMAAYRRTRDRHSGELGDEVTGRSCGWWSCAAGRGQAGAWVVGSIT